MRAYGSPERPFGLCFRRGLSAEHVLHAFVSCVKGTLLAGKAGTLLNDNLSASDYS
jgi:hypothetical protein